MNGRHLYRAAGRKISVVKGLIFKRSGEEGRGGRQEEGGKKLAYSDFVRNFPLFIFPFVPPHPSPSPPPSFSRERSRKSQ